MVKVPLRRDLLLNLTFTDMEHEGRKIDYHMEVQFCHQKMRLIRGRDFGGHDAYADARSAVEILEVANLDLEAVNLDLSSPVCRRSL